MPDPIIQPVETGWQWLRRMIEHHLDKLILVAMLCNWIFQVHHIAHLGPSDAALLAWAREQTTGVQGALLGLLTGVAIGRRIAANSDAGGKPNV